MREQEPLMNTTRLLSDIELFRNCRIQPGEASHCNTHGSGDAVSCAIAEQDTVSYQRGRADRNAEIVADLERTIRNNGKVENPFQAGVAAGLKHAIELARSAPGPAAGGTGEEAK